MGAPLVTDVYHALLSMILAVQPPSATLRIEAGHLRARVMEAAFTNDIHTLPYRACFLQYTSPLLPFALKPGIFGHEPWEHRLLRTFTMPSCAWYSQNARPSAALHIKAGYRVACVMEATLGNDVHHVILSMLSAVHPSLAAFEVESRPLSAGRMEAPYVG